MLTSENGTTFTVLEDGQMQIRKETRYLEDGVQVAHRYERHVVAPGDSVVGEDARVVTVAGVVHTAAVIAAYNAAEAARELARGG